MRRALASMFRSPLIFWEASRLHSNTVALSVSCSCGQVLAALQAEVSLLRRRAFPQRNSCARIHSKARAELLVDGDRCGIEAIREAIQHLQKG